MRSATRVLLSLAAATALVLSSVGAAGAARQPAAAPGRAATEVMGIFRGHDLSAAKPARPTRNNNLSSHGGPIQTTPAVYISWWGPEWSAGFTTGGYSSAQAQTYNNDFFNGVGGTSWNNVVTQYCQGVSSGTQTCPSGATFITNPANELKGSWNDSSTVPASPTQSQIAAAAVRLVQHFGYDPNATYMVYTPHGKSMSGFGTQWCAWHSSTSSTFGTVAYAYIPYIPDAGASCGMNFINGSNSYGNGYFDGFSIVAGHEYSEAETDPHPSSGWVDRQGAENADKCAWSSSSGNISFNGHVYAVQPTWSNATSGCAMSR
jgi:serine protease